MSEEIKKRVVAIVGRPNVGKSAMFNRLSKKRIAIVHEQAGVTRDRLMREVAWNDEHFELIDTGGIYNIGRSADLGAIEDGVHNQVDIALEDAAVVLFVVDVTAGVVSLDEDVATHLRKHGCDVFVAVNKCDGESAEKGVAVFEKFGFPVFPVSALQNRGFDELMGDVLKALPEAENTTIEDPLKVAVVGKPNVGKSSFINRLLRSNRVIVSDVPGTTRDSISVPFSVGSGAQARHYTLVDTAGMRRSGKVDSTVERFSNVRTEKSIKESDITILMLDASKGPTAYDKKIASAVITAKKGCVILVNKWDLAEEEVTQRSYGPAISDAMPFMGHCPVVFLSAETGYNIRNTIDAIDHVAAQIQSELPTGILNRTILDAYTKVRPPATGGRQLKLFYATQVRSKPIRIRLFVNKSKLVQDAYKVYLVKSIRRKFGLEGAPVILEFRSRR